MIDHRLDLSDFRMKFYRMNFVIVTHGITRYGCGSIQPLNVALIPRITSGLLGSRSVRCKCGPVELPLLPLNPTCSLAATIWPIRASIRERWAREISYCLRSEEGRVGKE